MKYFFSILFSFSFLFSFFFSSVTNAVVVSHTCTLNDLRTGSAPCECPITVLTPPFCPRLEGIKLPCIVKIGTSSCSYENGQAPPPPAATCLVAKSCDIITQGGCNAPLENYNCDTQTNGACLTMETFDCSTTSQGACVNFDEAGNCLGYAQVVTPRTCDRCTSYESITVPQTCQRCTAGYAQIPVHYENDEARCGCLTYSTP